MAHKPLAIEAIGDLPDNSSFQEIAERIRFVAAVKLGLDELDRHEQIPHEQVKEQLTSWLAQQSGRLPR